MPTIQLAPPSGFGGLVQGDFGNYQAGTDGLFTVDTRDAAILLKQGFVYTLHRSAAYTFPIAPAAASVGAIVASAALSNGTYAISAQPDVMRQVNVEIGTGTTAITGGTVAVVYTGNDGQVGTDVISATMAASTAVTTTLSRGVVTISSVTAAGVVGGTSPWVRLSRTATLALPVEPSTVDFAVTREYDAGATIAIGTLSASVLGGITPTTAPNATVTYAFAYTYVAPTF
jgi:hypothetical protein